MTTGRHRLRLTPRQRLGAVITALAILIGVPVTLSMTGSGAAFASAPAIGAPGVSNWCSRSDYSCTNGGYTGSEPWGLYTAWGSRDAAGRLHNCTTYVAYRLARNGVPKPNWSADAANWVRIGGGHGNTVDHNAAAGAVAQWNTGHVAFVESVSANSIDLTDDMYGVNKTNHWTITRGSPRWPDNFMHFSSTGTSGGGGGGTTTGGNQPVFPVMNTSETPPDGVWFRDNPNVSGPRLNGYGVYAGDRIQLRCYGWGEAIGAYGNRLWYSSANLTRPNAPGRTDVGWLNAHYVNDGQNANAVVPGVRPC